MAATNYPTFVGVAEANQLDQALDRIAQALVDRRAQFLFGAGMSHGSNLPLGSDLAVALLRRFFPGMNTPSDERLKTLAVEFPLESIVYAVEQKPGLKRDDLTRVLREIFINPNPAPNEGHHAFMSLLGVPPRISAVFTTNYDTLLEQVLGPDFAVAITEKNATNIDQERDGGKIPVIYLRGNLDGDYEITEREIGSEKFRLLHEELKIALHRADAFVFVGYSLSDIDFRQIYRRFLDQLKDRKATGKTTYFVSPPKDEFSYTLGKAIWQLRQAEWIPLDSKSFFTRLNDVVKNRFLADITAEVKKKYAVNDTEMKALIERTAKLWRMDTQDALLFLYEARSRIGG